LPGTLAVLALLLAMALALLPLHGQAWWLASPLPARWAMAAASVLAYLALCGLFLRPTRDASDATPATADGPPPVLVIWASQTGFAQALAERSATMLRGCGTPTRILPLDQVDADLLDTSTRALFIVSTTGEGDPPDHALRFLRDAMADDARPARLEPLRYALLALGDRSYADFCAFGRQLDGWLRRHGAQALFDPVEVDNADKAALRHWQYELGRIGGVTDLPDWSAPAYTPWRLYEREVCNPDSVGGPVFQLALRPADGTLPTWQPGDIAEIGPRNAPARVERLLADLHLDGDALVASPSGQERLDALLSRSHLPDPADAPLHDAQALADRLQPLPHREYSIASIPADGDLRLLVRVMPQADGSPGLGSGWLCHHVQPGGSVDLRLRSNPGFHPPADARPMILIGNGTGMAGLRAHLRARVAAGAPRNWLLFGERNADHDFFFGREIRDWQAQGLIERLDLAFSRDTADRVYVQDRLLQAADALRHWVADGASLHVCGNAQGMAPAVDAALADILGRPLRDRLREEGRYRRDVY